MSSDRDCIHGKGSARRADVFSELVPVIARIRALYAAAYYLDPERAGRLRRDLDTQLSETERNLPPDAPHHGSHGDDDLGDNRANRSTRINDEILSFLTDIRRPVTVDDVHDHLEGMRLGEPRDSLITRMSRLVASNRIQRRTRGYYEASLPEIADASSF